MSSIATATVLPRGLLGPLQEAAKPKKRLFGGTRDDFQDYLKKNGLELPDFDGQGYVLATLLCFLEKRGIDLMTSEHDDVAKVLASTRGATFFVLSDAVKTSLAAASFSPDELRSYYEEFNATQASRGS